MPRPHLVVILACALSPVFVACAEIMGDGVQDSGDVELAITRSTASQVPPEADSAVIRIAHPTAGTNLIRRVAIPNLGDTTRVSIRAPARSGYTIAVAEAAFLYGVIAGCQLPWDVIEATPAPCEPPTGRAKKGGTR